MAEQVAGDMYYKLDGQLQEIKRQLRQREGYPFDPVQLSGALHQIIQGNFGNSQPQVTPDIRSPEIVPVTIDLTKTGESFLDWLHAAELLHEALTSEKIDLLARFEIPEALLARTDIMPFYRPAGATNRLAMDWKVRLGMNKPYEETDVMKYSGAEGPKVPQLGFIARSVTPDNNTMNKSPRVLTAVKMQKNQSWLDLFGYSSADNLHFLIYGKHLDPETWTWFVLDRLHPGLPGGNVARGSWLSHYAQSDFSWDNPDCCFPCIGARLAMFLPLKT